MDMGPEEARVAINEYLDKGPNFIKYGGTSHFSHPIFIGFSPSGITTDSLFTLAGDVQSEASEGGDSDVRLEGHGSARMEEFRSGAIQSRATENLPSRRKVA